MPFYILSNKKIFGHKFDYLMRDSGRRLEPTLLPTKKSQSRDSQNKGPTHTWAIELMSKELIKLKPTDSIKDALEQMDQKRIHHLPIVDGENIIGIVSDRDLLKIRDQSSLLKSQLDLQWFMSKITILCHEETPIDHIAKVFCNEHINGILVIGSDHKLTGIITHHDLLKWIYDK